MEREPINASNLTVKRKRIMIYFIEATKKLIQTEGVDGLSIRKIATEAGYNSATLYNYFYDLEHLTLFGSVCYLRDYIIVLTKELTTSMSAKERFTTIYRCFNEFAFHNPDIFHNLFFGRYSDRLDEVLHTYYNELFPEELSGVSTLVKQMLISGNMRDRDRLILNDMVNEGFIAKEKLEPTLELIISLIQSFLYDACIQGEQLNIEAHKARFDQLFSYILCCGA